MITIEDISEFRAQVTLHCKMCLNGLPEGAKPRDWSRLSFGVFHKPDEPEGIYLQVWCDRHKANVTVIHIQTEAWDHAGVNEAALLVKKEDQPNDRPE